MKNIYQACDGRTFEIREDAMRYEDGLFDSWVQALIDAPSPHEHRPEPSLTTVVRHFSASHYLTCEGDEHHMTPWDRLKESLRLYWEDKIISG